MKFNSQNDQNSKNYESQQNYKKKFEKISKSNLDSFKNSQRSKHGLSNTYNYQTCPNSGHPEFETSMEFKKLEILMKDKEMKESILESLGLDSSQNSNSLMSLVEREMMGGKD